jgi:diguanylate cyclase (GGDEF)-like protein/PAS domain S-box-containing protein
VEATPGQNAGIKVSFVIFMLYKLGIENNKNKSSVSGMLGKDFHQVLLDRLDDHVFVCERREDGEYVLVDINDAQARFFRTDKAQMVGKTVRELVADAATTRRIYANYDRAFKSDSAIKYEEQSGDTHLGYQVFETTLYTIENEGMRYLCGISRNITKRKQAERQLAQHHRQLNAQLMEIQNLKDQLQQQAIRDPLTNLFNRRYLAEMLPFQLARAEREGVALSVVMLDIDRFKRLNDEHGHQVGDALLREVSRFLRRRVRKADLLFRYGGEEFLLLLPGTDAEAAQTISEQWREEFAQTEFHTDCGPITMTLSAGIASFPAHSNCGYTLVLLADQALYQAKAQGRNLVLVGSST